MNTPSISIFSFALFSIVFSVGCNKEIGDWREIEKPSMPVPFSGFTRQPSQKVQILAQDPLGNWESVAETTSSSIATVHQGAKWYYWKNAAVIPQKSWKPWVTGFVANVKASPEKSPTSKNRCCANDAHCDRQEGLWERNRCPIGVTVGVYAELDVETGD